MATKGSKSMSIYRVTAKVCLGPGKEYTTDFDVLPLDHYGAILGMPFMWKRKVIVKPGDLEVKFPAINHTIKCTTLGEARASNMICTSATIIEIESGSDVDYETCSEGKNLLNCNATQKKDNKKIMEMSVDAF